MSSAPSTSALSAVLRCRRNIWTRNSPSKQPLTAAHGLGTAGSPAERARSRTASSREAFALRKRVVMGKMITVVVESLQVGFRAPRNNQGSDPKLWQVEARRAASGVPNARTLPPTLKYACIYTFSSLNPLSALVFKLSVKCPPVIMKTAGEMPFSALPGWATPKRTCLALNRLVSECLNMRFLVVLRRSSIRTLNAPPHLQSQRAENIRNGSLKVSVRDLHRAKRCSELHGRRIPCAVELCSAFFFFSPPRNTLLASSQAPRINRVLE